MYSSFFGVVAAGFLAVGTYAHSAQQAGVAGFAPQVQAITTLAEPAVAAQPVVTAPPADLENDDSGDYMKYMTPAQLDVLYAEHDAEVARLMAAAPDEELFGEAALVDPATGETV